MNILKNKNLLIGGGLVLIVVAAFLFFGGTGLFSSGSQVVATVNGEEITKEELDLQVQQLEQSLAVRGQSNVSSTQVRDQALNQVIGRQLLIQEAKKQGITASSSEIDSRYQEVVSQAGGEEALNQRFQETGISEEELRNDLRDQVLIENYIEQRKQEDPDQLEVTEEDIVNRYEELSAQTEAEAPPLSDVREQLRMQLERENESNLINQIITELRSQANVEIVQ